MWDGGGGVVSLSLSLLLPSDSSRGLTLPLFTYTGNFQTILEDEQEIINCSSYTYLGTTVTQDGSLDKVIRERNNLGRKSMALLKNNTL